MHKKRLLWSFLILMSALLYFFVNGPITLGLLISVVVIPLISFVCVYVCKNKVKADVKLPQNMDKNLPLTIKVVLKNSGVIFTPYINCTLVCENLRTGEKQQLKKGVTMGPKGTKIVEFTYAQEYCGKVKVSLESLLIEDDFGLIKTNVPIDFSSEFIVMPSIFLVNISMSDGGVSMLDSDIYSDSKPGNDPGETFAIREYIPGDQIKFIHWKISSKLDKTMVRELGLPVIHQMAILFETGFVKGQTAKDRNAAFEILASVMNELTKNGISYVIGINEPLGNLRTIEIQNENEYICALTDLLSIPGEYDRIPVTDAFCKEYSHCPFTHVLVISSFLEPGAERIYNGNRVTMVVPNEYSAYNGLQKDGTYISTYNTESYAEDLCVMEV